jgi:hypothetical protein
MEILSQNWPEGTEENRDKSVRITDDPAEIQTKPLPNTSLERYF